MRAWLFVRRRTWHFRVVLFVVCLTAWFAVLPSDAIARECELNDNGPSGVQIVDLKVFTKCLHREILLLKRDRKKLEDKISALEKLSGEIPAEYSNKDGVVSSESGRAISRASFILSARGTGGPSAMPIDQPVLEELCDRVGGCALTVVLRQFSLFGSEPKEVALVGPCQFTYTADSGSWGLGDGCGAKLTGVDGDRSQSEALVTAAGACQFSESANSRSVGDAASLAMDHAQGLFLVSIPAKQPEGIRRFECELSLY